MSRLFFIRFLLIQYFIVLWTSWSEWSQCSPNSSCFDQTTRTRTCSGVDCPPERKIEREVHYCLSRPCYRWSSWSKWSACSTRCVDKSETENSQATRRRDCLNTNNEIEPPALCTGDWLESNPCFNERCTGGS